MPVSKKQQAHVTKYVKTHYDRLSVTVPLGKKEKIKAHVETTEESVNGFINRAIDETMQNDYVRSCGGVKMPELLAEEKPDGSI